MYLHPVGNEQGQSNAQFRFSLDPELCIRRPLFCFCTRGRKLLFPNLDFSNHRRNIIQTLPNHHLNSIQSSRKHYTIITDTWFKHHQNIIHTSPKHCTNSTKALYKHRQPVRPVVVVPLSVRLSVPRRRPFWVRPSHCLFPHRCPFTA